jgi:hypothetical protein
VDPSLEYGNKTGFMQCKHYCSLIPKRFQSPPLAGEIMAIEFYDMEGTLPMDYMSHKATITGDGYVPVRI